MEMQSNHQYQEDVHIEKLRLILESEQKREITLTEASEVGSSLIAFFEALADGSDNRLSEDTT